MNCQEAGELLLEFVEGELGEAEAQQVRTHLSGCVACNEKARRTRRMLGMIDAAESLDRSAWATAQGAKPAPPAAGPPRRLDDFELLEELGRGGMGVVYRARQLSLNRIVALKVLSAGALLSERAIARFRKEAQAAARLHHTNIVPVYAQGEQDGFVYYAMELIDGQPLDRVLAQSPSLVSLPALRTPPEHTASTARETDTRTQIAARSAAEPSAVLDVRTAYAPPTRHAEQSVSGASQLRRRQAEYKRIARLIAEVAEALHHAHKSGIVHRDIKPQNLLLAADDRLHITDFGLARLTDEPHLTLSAEVLGTPAYMSPEQIRGNREQVDHRTDIYSLGVTLYQMLTLKPPFMADTYEQVITRILRQEPRRPRRFDPHLPLDLETICLRAMDKDPRRRFATAQAMADDLRRFAGDFPIVSRRIGPLGRLIRVVKRHPALSAAAIAICLVSVLTPLLYFTVVARANETLAQRLGVLFEDYRESQAADDLGWVTTYFGDARQRTMLQAFAAIRSEPRRAIALLQPLLARRPNDREARYLLAWACMREEFPGAEVEAMVAQADASPEPESWAGNFFRGQALMWLDPVEAGRSFQRAIDARPNFVQAKQHLVRTMNFRMYLLRDVEQYGAVVANLDFVAEMQPRSAYPRYLLSIAHRLAAEVYSAAGDAERAAERYAQSLAAARDAQAVDPRNPRGYVAEAEWLESREQFDDAIAMFRRLSDNDIVCGPGDERERDKQLLRLYFWKGDCAAAEACRPNSFFKPLSQSATSPVLEALLARCGGDEARARAVLTNALNALPDSTVLRLDLATGFWLCGLQPPAVLFAVESNPAVALPARWTPDWVRLLADSLSGRRPWDQAEIEAAAQRCAAVVPDPAARRIRYHLLIAGARYYRGAQLLAAGRRDAALEQFADWWRHPDSENYCYLSKLLYVRLRDDPSWPPWLSSAASQPAPEPAAITPSEPASTPDSRPISQP